MSEVYAIGKSSFALDDEVWLIRMKTAILVNSPYWNRQITRPGIGMRVVCLKSSLQFGIEHGAIAGEVISLMFQTYHMFSASQIL